MHASHRSVPMLRLPRSTLHQCLRVAPVPTSAPRPLTCSSISDEVPKIHMRFAAERPAAAAAGAAAAPPASCKFEAAAGGGAAAAGLFGALEGALDMQGGSLGGGAAG